MTRRAARKNFKVSPTPFRRGIKSHRKGGILKRCGIKFCSSAFLILDIVLFSLFFWQYNSFISQNYQLGEYGRQIEELVLANEELGTGFVESNHLEKVEMVARDLNFEKTAHIDYIKVLTTGVVAK